MPDPFPGNIVPRQAQKIGAKDGREQFVWAGTGINIESTPGGQASSGTCPARP
ncbi:MAG: hypothetical protein WC378_00110 [Opitutaceae bacterium]